MAKSDWPKSFVIPSVAISVIAAGFLIWHVVDPAARVDGWTVTLLVVTFLPWLGTIFESLGFPGGATVKWQKVQAEQEQQADDIQALQFLLARFLTKPERDVLQRLARGESIPIAHEGLGGPTIQYVDSLRRMGLVAVKPELLESFRQKEAEGHTSMDVSNVGETFDITESGRRYLELLAKLPDDNAEIFPDGSGLRTGPSTPPL
ncbi:hypothetical protein [Mycobacterium sp. MMS18-G62]